MAICASALRRRVVLLLAWLACGLAVPVAAQDTLVSRVRFGDTGPTISSGTGSPEGVVSAAPGSLYLETDGAAAAVLWTKDGGTGTDTTGWVVPTGGAGGPHTLLGATHSDTSAAAALRGAFIVGNSTPAWSRLPITGAGTFIRSNGTDAGWSTDGSALTALVATNLASGTVPDARLSANVSLLGTAIDSSEITNGTIVFADWASNSCTANQIAKWSGSAWACATDEAGGAGFDQTLNSTDTPQFARLGLGVAADSAAVGKFAGQYYSPEVAKGNSGAALTINWNDGVGQATTLTLNCTFTFSNPKDNARYLLVLIQDGTGSRTVTWPGTIKWSGGVAPTLTPTASAVDLCTFVFSVAAGNIYLAQCGQDFR